MFNPARTLYPQFSFLAARLVGMLLRAPWSKYIRFIREHAKFECFLKYEQDVFQISHLLPSVLSTAFSNFNLLSPPPPSPLSNLRVLSGLRIPLFIRPPAIRDWGESNQMTVFYMECNTGLTSSATYISFTFSSQNTAVVMQLLLNYIKFSKFINWNFLWFSCWAIEIWMNVFI